MAPRYSIGIQDFEEIRKGGFIYVDKTSFIPILLEQSKYYFLARPRRFGKSLFLSTLEAFFSGQRDLFKGLAIYKYNWDWSPYPVIHIDLNGANYTNGKETIIEKLSFILKEQEIKYGIKNNYQDISLRFQYLISKLYEKTGKQIVVLIDEYEKPVLDTIGNKEINDWHRETLRGFYGVLKSLDKYLKLVFLTGVTKFGQMNVFSGLNNIRDISLNPKFGSICGITQDELLINFQEGISQIAEDRKLGKDEILLLLKKKYDGYHFSWKCPDIYNPYSLINAFADGKISSYWVYTGTPALLANVLRKRNYDLKKLDGIKVHEKRLLGLNDEFDDPVALFYQTGYLTIKNYDEENEEYILSYPNIEVEEAFFDYLLPDFTGQNVSETSSFIDELRFGFEKGDPKKSIEVLEEFFSGISYDVIPAAEVERHFQYIIYIICKLLIVRRQFVKVEEKTSNGRIDLLIATNDYVYIIEIKRDRSAQEALNQIKEKEYALQWRNDPRKVFLIGINFSTGNKRINDFKISTVR